MPTGVVAMLLFLAHRTHEELAIAFLAAIVINENTTFVATVLTFTYFFAVLKNGFHNFSTCEAPSLLFTHCTWHPSIFGGFARNSASVLPVKVFITIAWTPV